MPIEIYKDEEGNEKKRYVLPQGVVAGEESQTESQETGNDDDGFGDAIGRTLAQGGRDLIQNIYDAGYDTLADLGFQDNAGKTNRFTGEEVPPGLQFGLRNPFQGEDEAGNDYKGLMRLNPLMKYREEGDNRGFLGLTPTSFDKPDAPLPFYGKPLPEFAETGTERFLGQMISSISQFMLVAKGLKARGVKVPQVPIGGKLSKSLLKAPKGDTLKEVATGFAKRGAGRFIRGAQEGWLPGAINDVFLEDPWDGNAATLLTAMLPDGDIKRLVNQFQVDEDDTRSEAMLKNGIIGTFLAGPLLGGGVEQFGGVKKEGLILLDAFADYLASGSKVAKKLDIERGVKNPIKPPTENELKDLNIVKLTGREKKTAAEQAADLIKEQDKIQQRKEFPGTSGQQITLDDVSKEIAQTKKELEKHNQNIPPEVPEGERIVKGSKVDQGFKEGFKRSKSKMTQAYADRRQWEIKNLELLNKIEELEGKNKEIGTNEAVREFEQKEKKLKTVLARTKILAEAQRNTNTTKSVDIQPPTMENMQVIDTLSIRQDPVRFQYKDIGSRTKTGTTGSLAEVATYNPDLAGVISVWKDPVDGQVYVVNGHNRLNAAIKNQFPTMNVRFLEAPDAATARVKGAMQNIAEGNGTGIDAAKIIRETKMGAAEMIEQGISPSGAIMRKAIPLSKLPDSIFTEVATQRMTEDMGAAIGSSNSPDQVMFDLAKAAKKKGWSAAKTAEAASIAQFAKVSEGVDPNALPLPGFNVLVSSNYENILNIRIAIRSQLKSEINALGVAANTKKAGTLESVGNIIDVDASKAARDQSIQGERIFNSLANLSGPLNDVINDLAKQVKGNTRAATVVQGNIKKIKNAMAQENVQPKAPVKQVTIAPEEVVKNNPTEINKKPDLKKVQVTVEPTRIGTVNTPVEPTLPKDLKRKDINYRGMRVSFSTDIDYAAYVVTKKRNGIIRVETTGGSKRNADYLNFLMNDVGFTEQDIVRIKSRTLEYLSNNYASGSTYRFTGKGNYYFLGLKPGQLSLDPLNGVNPIHKRSYGTLGNDYSGATLLNYREKFELVEEIERMAGKGVNIQFVRELEGTLTAKQAADYGLTEGDSYSAAGEFISGKNPADDLIMISMFSKGGYRGFSSLLRTAFHESFHRIQKRLLSKADKEALIAGEKEIRELAAKTMPEFRESILDGTLGRQEIEAIAFSDWYMRNTDYPKATWSEPFKKIAQIIERTGNFLKGRGYQTWDDVFERSMRGETAEQALGDSLSAPATQLAIDPPDAESFSKAFNENLEQINNGDMSIEDALANEARRLVSRSGKTRYVSSPTEATLAANKTINDTLYQHIFNRAEATGIADLNQAVVYRGAINLLKEHGGDADTLIPLVERALKGDIKSQEDLIAIRAIQIQRDRVLKKLGVQAQTYLNTTGAEKATELQALKAMLGDQLKLDIAYMSPLRKAGQTLNIGKTMFRDDIDLVDLPSEVTLYKGMSQDGAQKTLADGFDTTQETGAMGQGVYFTTDENSISLQDGFDGAELYGDSIKDIKIFDLSARNQRISDLIADLGLGNPKKTKNGLELTPDQINGVKTFLAERGYAGIRYEPRDTGRPNPPADEIVIFDNNSANRIVGSDASVPPTATPDAPKRTLLEQAIGKSKDVLDEKLDPDLLDAIDNGKLTPEAEQAGDVMVAIATYAQQNKGFNKHFADLLEQTTDKSLTGKRLLNYYRGAILLSGETTWKMMIGGLYRAATLPVIQSMGGFTQGFTQSLKGNKGAAYKSFRRARLSAMLYGKYYQNLGNALRLMKATILENETFGNLGVDQMQLRTASKYNPTEQMNLGGSPLEINKKNDIWYTDPNNKNTFGNVLVRLASIVPKTTGRLAGSVDTLMSTLVGPSQEWVRYVDQELYKAETILGMRPGSDEAWEYASNKATELVKAEMVDVTLANGKTIQNAALTGDKAKYVMDWVNFTDSLDVVPAPRTYEYGVREAREGGITDPADIHNHAKRYVDNDSNIFKENKVAGTAQFIFGVPKAMGNLVENSPWFGLIYPLPRGPVNIVKASMRSLGVTAPLVDTFWRDITSEDVFTRDRAIGEISFGVTTLLSGIALLNTGLVEFTGFRSANYRRREIGPEGIERGREPMAIRFKNPFSDSEEWTDYYSLQTTDTLSNIFGMIGEYVEFGNSVPEEDQASALGMQALAIAHVAKSLGAGQFTKSILSSVIELFDAFASLDQDSQRKAKKGSTDSFSRYIERRLSGFMPAFVRKMNTGEPRRDIVASELPYPFSMIDNSFQRMRQQIPGAAGPVNFAQGLPPILHSYSGEPINERHYAGSKAIPEDMPWMKYLFNLVTPTSAFPSRTKSSHPVDVELSKLYGKGANYMPWHNNIFNIPGEVLNVDELNRLKVIGTQEIKNSAGKTLWEELTDLVTIDPTYAGLPYSVSSDVESARMTMIKEKVKYFRDAAKKQYLEERPDIKKLLDERDQKIVDKNFIRDNLNKIREKQSRIENRQFLDQLN